MKTVDEILTEWNQEAKNLELSVASRSYKAFKKSFSNGCRCFKQLREMIETGHSEELKKHGPEIKTTLENWQKSAESLPDWMQELSSEVKKVRKKQTNQKKIGNAYKFMKKAGNNLRVKAK